MRARNRDGRTEAVQTRHRSHNSLFLCPLAFSFLCAHTLPLPVQYMLQIWSKYVPTTQFTQTLPVLEPILSLVCHCSSWSSYELELRMRKPTRQPSPRQACTKPQRVQPHQLSTRLGIRQTEKATLTNVIRNQHITFLRRYL
jgi:hypothetical protein